MASNGAPEEEIGISVYLTSDVPGIGGRLKRSPEEFLVEEISLFPDEDPGGSFTAVLLRHKNWEMNRLIRRLSKKLRIGRNSIAFAGTKDKRSVSTQLITYRGPPEAIASLFIPDVEFLSIYRARAPTRLGALLGNRFTILVSGPHSEGLEDRVERVTERLMSLAGFPNFFGVQRFGAARPVTHLIGKEIIQGDFERGAMLYLAEDTEYEEPECQRARRFVAESRDFKKAMEVFPQHLTFERTVLGHLSRRPDDFPGAIRALPRNLVMMFVHSYQSCLFNRILSERIRRGLPLNKPVVGDIVLPLDKAGLPDRRRPIPVTRENLALMEEQIRQGRGFVSGALFGSETVLAEGEMGDIERGVIDEESLSREDFIVPELAEASSKGSRRELLAPVRHLSHHLTDERDVLFRFELNKGCYATSLLREYMKAEMIDY